MQVVAFVRDFLADGGKRGRNVLGVSCIRFARHRVDAGSGLFLIQVDQPPVGMRHLVAFVGFGEGFVAPAASISKFLKHGGPLSQIVNARFGAEFFLEPHDVWTGDQLAGQRIGVIAVAKKGGATDAGGCASGQDAQMSQGWTRSI